MATIELTDHQRAFLMKEYDALRKELDFNRAASEKLITFGLGAVGIVWAFIFSKETMRLTQRMLLELVPVTLTILFMIRSWGLSRANKEIGAYISKVEALLDLQTIGLGWESHIRFGGEKPTDHLRITTSNFWLIALVVQATEFIKTAAIHWSIVH